MGWSSFPPEHKKSLARALGLYACAVALVAGWVWLHSDATLRDWQKRTPLAIATVKTVTVDNLQGDTAAQTPAVETAIPMPPPSAGEGYISLIMTDVGLSEADTARAMQELPTEVTLAFSPYSPALSDWLKKAKDANRDTLILLPMEPVNYPKEDPGPQALLMRQSDQDNARRLESVLRQSGGTVGAMNFMGSSLLEDEKNITSVMTALRKRSGLFIEDPQGGDSVASDIAERTGTPYLRAEVKIDAKASELDINQQLLNLENIAKQRGYAVGIAQPYPVTFTALKNWTSHLQQRGIKLVPLAAIWQEKNRQQTAAEPPPMPNMPAPNAPATP
ncbi:MAG: Divergent polysaccharide deacetylase [Alphaproteobacteria bacterium]|jgi:polysaccharide deacetylase 2 family uncharacterized protein YibQ|nr:Divergent polysaccharide deacetylase [Alphaproteobacteria bacterium]